MLTNASRSWVEVDLKKIRHNVEEVEKLIPAKSKVMAIVKANAYGHGDIACAKELVNCGIDFFGVSSIDEAIVLREHGIKEKILVLGYTPPVHFPLLAKYDILQTLLSLAYANKLDVFCAQHHVQIQGHVKVDTGMSRLGVLCQDHAYHIEEVQAIYQLHHCKAVGIFSHFSVSDCLDEANASFTRHQIALFDRVIADLKEQGINPGTTHLQNSYGILNYPELAYDYVRPGLLWMGVTSDDAIAIQTNPNFDPILQWKANVSLVKAIKPGVSVSYGRHFQAQVPSKIATLSVGYADGYPRCVSNGHAGVLLHGCYAPIIGNICMDQMMVDVTAIPDVKEGDIAVLVGEQGEQRLLVDELSRQAHTINNETLCWISARVPRMYK